MLHPDVDQLRISLDRLRTLLENLAVRGLRACGENELAQLKGYADELQNSAAGHVAGNLATLHQQIENDDRNSPRTLIMAQTSVRMLERLLTLRVAKQAYAQTQQSGDEPVAEDEFNDDEDDN